MSIQEMEWKRANADVFWGEIAPCDHVVQIYENDSVFLDALAGFVGGGIKAGDCVIVIATGGHLKALHNRLSDYSVRVDTLIADDRYIPLDAEETLSHFMVDGWPDKELFIRTVSSLISRGRCRQRRIRAFGEMVAILWAQGLNGATVHLEYLWNKFCEQQEFCLFCAYPKTGFTQDINASIRNICSCHTKMIEGSGNQLTEITYSNVSRKAV
jgi:MEDS: MEthanogen/methylotroph, DcmR Sensory domain